MSHVRSFFRPLAVALTLTFVAAPLTALAHPGVILAGTKTEAAKDEHKRFPMAADRFEKRVEKRIDTAREKLEKRMGKRNVPEGERNAMRKRFESRAGELRAAAKAAGADGKITAEEAKEIRERARELRQKGKEKRKEHRRDKREGKAA
jgi:Skp family chaperone for outer membrane proteins